MAGTTLRTPVSRFRDVAIVGGGCYGTFYTRQLERARGRGSAEFRRLLVVDRDPRCQTARELGESPDRQLVVQEWSAFFDAFLGDADRQEGGESVELGERPSPGAPSAPDAIVPSPLMPHLMYEWLVRRARKRWPHRLIEQRPVPEALGTPYDAPAPDGTRYVSFADWLCPVHCVEPATCPMIAAPRTWEMADAVASVTARLGQRGPAAGPVLLVCRHRVYGVGAFDVAEVLAGDRVVAEAGAAGTPVDVVIGTVSSCHGAVSLLHLGAA